MASARQIAANRRNAQKSTGPRTAAGKRRASRNAYRHGFAAAHPCDAGSAPIEVLAHEIATAATSSVMAASDPEILAFARVAAQAEHDLARIRSGKTAAIEALFTTVTWRATAALPSAAMDLTARPTSGQPLLERSPAPIPGTEAVRISGRKLLMLDRYEQRATQRRDQAVLRVITKNALLRGMKDCGGSLGWIV